MPQGPSFWFDTRVYLAVAALLLLIILFYNPYVALLGGILIYVLYLYSRERNKERQKELSAYVEAVGLHVNEACSHALSHLPQAIALVDGKGILHWGNMILFQWAKHELVFGKSIHELWPEIPLEALSSDEGRFRFHAGSHSYAVLFNRIEDTRFSEETLFLLYLQDITETENLRKDCYDALPAFSYVQIDNYVDVVKGLNEAQKTSLLGEVNQKLVEWASDLDGVLKKSSDDLYIALFSRKALERVISDKFDILDQIRSIQGGNKMPFTLSMGVAADELSLAKLEQKAQAGLDLALGRGGDQAALYYEGKVQFYGGKTKAVEKNTRVRARMVSQVVRETIHDADLVFVMGHAIEDFDSLGAAVGMAKMATWLNKTTHIVVSAPNDAIQRIMELVPGYEEYEDLFINRSEADEILKGGLFEKPLLIVVDTHKPDMVAAPELLTRISPIIVIDHHRRAEDFIANPLLVYLEPSASSTSELVTELLMYFDDHLDLTRLEASALYSGIIVDTKHFTVQTGVRTFEAASYLRRSGADPSLVRQLFRMDLESLKARAEILTRTEMYEGGMIIAVCPKDVKDRQVLAAQAADMLLGLEGVTASFVLIPTEDYVGVSARSQGDINVQLIMESLGGGGHQMVAGVQIKQVSVEEVKEKIITLFQDYLKESGKK